MPHKNFLPRLKKHSASRSVSDRQSFFQNFENCKNVDLPRWNSLGWSPEKNGVRRLRFEQEMGRTGTRSSGVQGWTRSSCSAGSWVTWPPNLRAKGFPDRRTFGRTGSWTWSCPSGVRRNKLSLPWWRTRTKQQHSNFKPHKTPHVDWIYFWFVLFSVFHNKTIVVIMIHH